VSRPRSHIHREDGQALVEFALVVPVLLLILLGVIWLGKAFNYWNDATHLSAEGARYAAVNRKPDPSNASSLQLQIRMQADTGELRNGQAGGAVTSPAQVCIDFPNTTSAPRDPVRVSMSFSYHWIPLLNLGPSTTITSTTVMALEASPTNYTAGCA
jgi:TadE-like protein